MRKIVTVQLILICMIVASFYPQQCLAQRKVELQRPTKSVGKYEKIKLRIAIDGTYNNPFDPNEADLTLVLKTPGGKEVTLPAFYCQDYEQWQTSAGISRSGKMANWYYPIGQGSWKARFAPTETGTYTAIAVLKDRSGLARSNSIDFDCTASSCKGFLQICRKDPRFLEFSEGGFFFAIGQNLAFIGESQYVDVTKAQQIFSKLAQNGANFLRIWTCCEDWAMAIEAKKSAWDRSWSRKAIVVPVPEGENNQTKRKCVKLEGGDGASITVEPSHPVAIRPQTHYVLSGRFKTKGPSGLRAEIGRRGKEPVFDAAPDGGWRNFKHEFVSGENDFWLGRVALSLVGAGTIWLDNLSLKEAGPVRKKDPNELSNGAGGGPELLWEADVNRPIRGFYNQVDCFMLDQLIESARQKNIYLMLCVITRDLYMNSLSDDKGPEYEQAIRDARNLMRYAVARWGYSTNVAAWEYFNEIDPGKPTDRFYDELGKFLEQIDIYHHLRTTSTWHPSAKDCRHPRLDIGQLHHYMRPNTKENYKDEVEVILDKARFLREHAPGKPVLIGEFGLATEKWGLSDDMKQDKEAVHFHNSLWASAFAGISGTSLFWWWDQLDRQDAYGHYQPLATFLAGVSLAGLGELKATTTNEQVRLLGYQGNDCAYIWLFNRQASWWNLVIEKKQPKEIKGTKIDIQNLKAGNYRVEWWHTREGKIIDQSRVSFTEGPLQVLVPPLSMDIACKIKIQKGR